MNTYWKRACSMVWGSLCLTFAIAAGAAAQSGGARHDEYCEPGVIECAWGLFCLNNFCKTASAGEGEECGPAAGRTCTGRYDCDPELLVCVAKTVTGQENSVCFSNSDCNEGLDCRDTRCKPIPTGQENTRCRDDLDCGSGLVCDFFVCVPRPDRFCRFSDECAPGMSCENNRCLRDDTSGATGAGCLVDDHCDDGLVCVNYECTPE